ncbi:MAG: hypothetical protein EZS28_005480 [Streblomastix strix]|uniref:Uncharacterized protein n=1 Tax=Streblomastix strix TaxID=222440 RepID=A0A5J4WVB9_9EUKA|nr:MAG: hypothetical protein EZS28_005480 [Streblomastix strix]
MTVNNKHSDLIDCELPSSNNYYTATSGGYQCDFNLSPVQSGCQIIELLAALEIDRPERQNTKWYSAYLEKPRKYAQPRSPETQDRIQGRFRCAFQLIQDYLVRTGRRCYNPGPGLFRKVLESNIRDPKEERRLAQDPGLLNSELRVENRVIQARGDYIHSENNNAQRLGNNDRPALNLPSYLSSRGNATISVLQLQLALLLLQRNAVLGFNGLDNLYKMLQIRDCRSQEATQLVNLRQYRRYSDSKLGSHNIAARNTTNYEDSTAVSSDDRNGQEPSQSHADS